ncbi:hypothetical protein CEUSTIGMA_g2996.t1 [Chlamydomonas eustigma]|uniref:Uncharacterized protein n=1 Tax=Chlamydomonas eustigma TaxID=1157962 RepID=A0A250WXI7_9CHLO|nr:hypothetical protein CEUSTIGMA_g2996.t1 [Chlamydomonas eustigma]|eukprot:GAX75553.1 hypothetical protein CEUSTIGMA_g2996.t1 [Chlamydomonas eustigma]
MTALTEQAAPWLRLPAGLTSGQVQRSLHRGSSCVEGNREYHHSGSLPHRPSQYPNIDSAPSLRTYDISGAKPRWQPMSATADTKTPIPGKRCTSPLKPQYVLPGPSRNGDLSSSMDFSKSARLSSSLDTRDITGSWSKAPLRANRGAWGAYTDAFNVRDINAPRSKGPLRPSTSLSTQDIHGACAPRTTRAPIITPGMGTLRCSDVDGASPGRVRAACESINSSLTSSFMMGRWPAPSAYSFEFSQQPRKTLIQKPVIQAP